MVSPAGALGQVPEPDKGAFTHYGRSFAGRDMLRGADRYASSPCPGNAQRRRSIRTSPERQARGSGRAVVDGDQPAAMSPFPPLTAAFYTIAGKGQRLGKPGRHADRGGGWVYTVLLRELRVLGGGKGLCMNPPNPRLALDFLTQPAYMEVEGRVVGCELWVASAEGTWAAASRSQLATGNPQLPSQGTGLDPERTRFRASTEGG
jgi:hypothetical protein